MPTIPSPSLRTDVLQLFGDYGADTIDRYFAQIEYTAVWCARMLDPRERVRVVIPEAVEDLVVLRHGRLELRQAKSRDESVGAWSLQELVPILGAQYARSYAFGDRQFSFHFVSDARAEARVNRNIGSLEALKDVLDLRRRGMSLSAKEATALRLFRERLPCLIAPYVRPPTGDVCDEQRAEAFLLATHIETNDSDFRTPLSLELLHTGLIVAQPWMGHRTLPELRAIYDQLLLLIVKRIREGTDLRTRAILRADVIKCCEMPIGESALAFNQLYPGKSMLEAKALHGGFDQFEVKQFRQQMGRAKVRKREIAAMQLGQAVEDLDLAVGELQRRERRALMMQLPPRAPFGPSLLEHIRPQLAGLATQYLPAGARPDVLLCQGLLWEHTQRCRSAWHAMTTRLQPPPSIPLVAPPAPTAAEEAPTVVPPRAGPGSC
jgi:hypothetical protein